MKKPTLKEQEKVYLSNINSFMQKFGIEEINFGKHSVKKIKQNRKKKKITNNNFN